MTQEWRSMDDTPDYPTPVLYWYGRLPEIFSWSDEMTSGGRDERFNLGFWDGSDWRDMGTGKTTLGIYDEIYVAAPTLWKQIDPPTKEQ